MTDKREIIPNLPALIPIGRPPHVPDAVTRRMVTIGAGTRMKMKSIAAVLGISFITLKKHYQYEIDNGKADCDLIAGESLFKAIQSGDSNLIKYYMTNQMKFEDSADLRVKLEIPTDGDKVILNRYIEREVRKRMQAQTIDVTPTKENDKDGHTTTDGTDT